MLNMLKLVLIIFIFSSLSYAQNFKERRNKIISIINEELEEVKRISTRGGEKDPDLILRMAELYLEKARLFREQENSDYLSLPTKKRLKVNKKKYFSRSSLYFESANNECRKITTKFKNYSRIGEVYYILGHNAKEAGKFKRASAFLGKAGNKSKSKKIKVKSQLTLADIHFNNKKFNKAKLLYEKSLKKSNDKWWTKDSFNLAWCYYHLSSYKAAINKMKEVYERSREKRYVDMRGSVERDIGLFFATSGRIDEGVRFYKKLGVKFSKRLFGIALNLKTKGDFKGAEKILNYAVKYSQDKTEKVEIYLELLDIHQRSSRYGKHAKITELILQAHNNDSLSDRQRKVYLFQVEKVAAILQRQVLSKTYKRLKKQRRQKFKQTQRYFEIMGTLDNERYDEFQFLKGETAYAMKHYSEAFNYYRNSFNNSVRYKKTKFKRKAMDNMLVTLSFFKKKYELNVYAFEAFVKNYSQDKRSRVIYGRLFNNYMSMKNYDEAENTLVRFSKKYPKDKSQEVMIAQLMDVSRKQGDNKKVRTWIQRIDNGEFSVGRKYKSKLQELLTTMQMENVQSELKKGNKKFALIGYLDVLKDKYSTKRSKINAKYNLAALYYDLGDVENSYRWSIEAIKEMGSKDILRFQESFITISNFLFMSLELNKSAKLSYAILDKICKKSSKRKEVLFKNAGFMSLANGDFSMAEKVKNLGSKCRVKRSTINELSYEIMRESFFRKDYKRYESYVKILSRQQEYEGKLVDEYINLMKIHRDYGNENKKNMYYGLANKAYLNSKRKRKRVSLKSLEYFSGIKLKAMRRTYSDLGKIEIRFPEKVFQKSVQNLLRLLDRMVEQANDVIQVGAGAGIVKSYLLLEDSYKKVADRLSRFTPPGKSKNYIKGFKKEFSMISKQMLDASRRYRVEAKMAIKKNKILSQENFKLQDTSRFPAPVKFYGASVIMDRGGLK